MPKPTVMDIGTNNMPPKTISSATSYIASTNNTKITAFQIAEAKP
jgi:hypothetical protein